MKRERFPAKELLSLFKRKKVSDLAEIKEALGSAWTENERPTIIKAMSA